MLQQEKLIKSINEAGLGKQVKVMVGGAPVSKEYAGQIGADGFAEDAISAVDLAYRLADAPA
jgi:5-methyltetrahydrofolate--homocysteine methyltransferase